ncbi:amidohydrolase family protein [Marinoscillum sp. 108]|uniref:amidohydrolase family protein n=1 Tax=Marinoscillum sp. 108 TaxID=2653151 RepID=UPI0012EF179E|nr:amidohydrolase family protein [Marinoscillum sp. 108]VXD20591.1 Amidohydrolase [Marinoscillum sp. 108]
MRYPFALLFVFITGLVFAQTPAPERTEGDGPYDRLIIRGATLINGNGAPPMGPVDIVITKNKISQISIVGYPGVSIDNSKRPRSGENDHEIDAEGMYVLPGFIDMHGHIGSISEIPAEYVFKLWMAHGITTIREPGSFQGRDWTLDHKKRSSKNEITAPRIISYTGFGMGSDGINTEEEARKWVRANAEAGSDGIKFFGARPEIMKAALEENKKLGLGAACHHAQTNVAWLNVLNSSEWGLTTMEHWYGLPEAMFHDRTVQHYPADYNYQNEQQRFEEAGKLWEQAAAPGSEKWNEVMNTLLARDFTLDPTFNIYEANRDLMRARNADWHKDYTLPVQWDFYAPSKVSHGSYWHAWGTEQEVAWKKNYLLWMTFVNEYKNRGGRVTTGSDSGYIYQLYGFAYIRELELLREAGFHPLEVIRSATLMGAEALGLQNQIGTIEVGKLADLVLVEENPLADLKVLYGTGAIRLTEENEIIRAGGVKYTIKDGIVYDAKELLKDVREMVKKAKLTDGEITQPGYPNWD